MTYSQKIHSFFLLLAIVASSNLHAIRRIYNKTDNSVRIIEYFQQGASRQRDVASGAYLNLSNNAQGIAMLYQHASREDVHCFNFPYGSFNLDANYSLYAEVARTNAIKEDRALAEMLVTADPLFQLRQNFFTDGDKSTITLVCIDAGQTQQVYPYEAYPLKKTHTIDTYANPWLQKEYTADSGLIFYTAQIENEHQAVVIPDENRCQLPSYTPAALAIHSANPINLCDVPVVQALRAWFSDEDAFHTISQRSYKADLFHRYPTDLILKNLCYASVEIIRFYNALGQEIPHYLESDPVAYSGVYVQFTIPGNWYNPKKSCKHVGHIKKQGNGILGQSGSFEVGIALGTVGRAVSSLYITHLVFIPNNGKNMTCWHDANPDSNLFEEKPFELRRLGRNEQELYESTGFLLMRSPEVSTPGHYIGGQNRACHYESGDEDERNALLESNPNDASFEEEKAPERVKSNKKKKNKGQKVDPRLLGFK